MSNTDTAKKSRTVGPSKAELDRAIAAANEAANYKSAQPGTVLGTEPGWVHYVLDLNLPEGRLVAVRAGLEAKGWSKVEPTPEVVGFSQPEVWRFPEQVYKDTYFKRRAERDEAARRKARILNRRPQL